MSSQMSLGVVAMRLRLALLRHRMPIEADRLLTDADYAVEVWALCVEVGDPALIALAERLLHVKAEATAMPVPATAAAPPVIGGPPQGPADADPGGDPASPRERRYLRGAR